MKKISAAILVFVSMLSAFAHPVSEQSQSVLTDMAGRQVTVENTPQRIVSGYYISTSACIALDLTDSLVAIESLADKRPIYGLSAPQLINLPNVGTAKSFNLEACLATEPDLVILPIKQKSTADILCEMGIPAIVVNPESHEQILEMFRLIGQITGKTVEASRLCEAYQEKLDFIEEKVKTVSAEPKVYICGTDSYLRTAPSGMYQASLIRTAGGQNAGDVMEGSSWKEISYEMLLNMNPDIIIVPTNSNANGTPNYTVEDILNDSVLNGISAIKSASVYQMPVGFEAWDSPAPSGILGALWMLKTVHPELYDAAEFSKDVRDFYVEFYGFDSIAILSNERI